MPSLQNSNFSILNKIDLSKPLDVIDESKEEQQFQQPHGSNISDTKQEKFPSSGSSEAPKQNSVF